MKKKILNAKLSLKKKIISPLSMENGIQVVGGAATNQPTCGAKFSCDLTCASPTTTQTIRVSECGPVTCQAGCGTLPGQSC